MLFRVASVALIVFAVAVVARIATLISLPINLRWELYPVAHEKNARYGGSFFERLDWWKHRREKHRLAELAAMAEEILLLKGVWTNNRSLWYRSFPFHFGLYVLAFFIMLLVAGGILQSSGMTIVAKDQAAALAIHWATRLSGFCGLALMGVGALALLLRRISDPVLRPYNTPSDYVNLLLFVGTSAVALTAAVTVDQDFVQLRGFMQALVTLNVNNGEPGGLVFAEILLGSILLAYIPLTHMSHFFTKWFMYHDIRWNDHVSEVGSPLESKIQKQLGFKVSWAADHIQ